MNKLDPEKLHVRFFRGATLTHPVNSRHYTLTHSDQTGDLYLSIGLEYQYSQITKNRDEVLARWNNCKIEPALSVYIHVDSEPAKPFSDSLRRFNIFKQELPLALEAIRFGDQALFTLYPCLDCATLLIYFESIYPALCKIEYWGTFANYR